MEIHCPVSLGEVLDKISILRIKLERITENTKREHVRVELGKLEAALGDPKPYEPFLKELREHNTVIWDVEDLLRAKEKRQEFDVEFIKAARLAYLTNDKRFAVKARVNQRFGSAIQEQKSHDVGVSG